MKDLTAHIGFYPEWNCYLGDYEKSVEILFGHLNSGEVLPDEVAFSLTFLMRQTIELAYKFSIWHLLDSLQESEQFGKYEKHDLLFLHTELSSLFCRWHSINGQSPDLMDQFKRLSAPAGELAKWFSEIDSQVGTAFRFPRKLKRDGGGPNFEQTKKIDLAELKKQFDASLVLLTTTPDVVSIQ